MSALTWNKEFELYDGSYSLSDVQDWTKITTFLNDAFQPC